MAAIAPDCLSTKTKGDTMYFKWFSFVVIALFLSGCGTIHTVGNTDAHIRNSLGQVSTFCGSIPRVYSGFAFNCCTLYSRKMLFDPKYAKYVLVNPHGTNSSYFTVPWWVFDMAMSGALDTALLPYTIVSQIRYGNIEIDDVPDPILRQQPAEIE